MKKLISVIFIGLFVMYMGMTVNASDIQVTSDETKEVETPKFNVKAGIKPGNPFYFLDTGIEDLRIWLVSDESKEAELLLSFAEERLSELNGLSDDKAEKHVDKLYQAYGLNLEQVNTLVSKLIIEEEIDEDDINEIVDQLEHTATIEGAVKASKSNGLTDEVKEKISNSQIKSYAVGIAVNSDFTKISHLKENGFGYGEILKLAAIAEVSGMPIEDLMYLDIFTSNDGESEIDFVKLAVELNIDKTEVQSQFKEYQAAVKTEQKNKKDEIKTELNAKLTEVLSKHKSQFLEKIDGLYTARLEMIQSLDISEERKNELISELDAIKQTLIKHIEEKVEQGSLNPRDIGAINNEITVEFNALLAEIPLDADEKDKIGEKVNDLSNLVEPAVIRIVRDFERKYAIVVTNDQLDKLITGTVLDARENEQLGKGNEFLREIQQEVLEDLKEMFKQEIEEFEEANRNNRNNQNNDNEDKEEDNVRENDDQENEDREENDNRRNDDQQATDNQESVQQGNKRNGK